MNDIAQGLLTASIMLTLTWAVAALFLRHVPIATPRMRQFILAGVLLQGLMLIRMPVDLPWLQPRNTEAASFESDAAMPLPIAEGELPRWGLEGGVAAAVPSTLVVSAPRAPSRTVDYESWILPALLAIWIAGTMFLVVRGILQYRRLCRLVDRLPVASSIWFEQWAGVCRTVNRAAPPMRISETAGPMLVRRPHGYVLVVPRFFWESLTLHERRGVLMHELAHLCRRDVWRQAVVRLAAAVHWWNPAAWWCVRHFEESAEWACDQFLTQHDPRAAKGLATSLVRLVEEADSRGPVDPSLTRGLGMQSMAAPPLTERVTRLLRPVPAGDSAMKQIIFSVLAVGLLSLSIVQFRFVAAQAPDADESFVSEDGGGLEVLGDDTKRVLSGLKKRLDLGDNATAELAKLLEDEAGQIAITGVLDELADRERELARSDALPRFIEKHFEENASGDYALRSTSVEAATDWAQQASGFAASMNSLAARLKSIATKMSSDGETNQIAQRMLQDEHSAAALMIVELDGRIDPIQRFLDEAMERILVQRGDKLMVIPNLPREPREHLDQFEAAAKVFAEVRRELPLFADEMATPDEQHEQLVKAMRSPGFAAIVAFELAERIQSPTAAVEQLLSQIEQVSYDTAKGLEIREEEAWEHLGEMMELGERAEARASDVHLRLRAIARRLDMSDPASARVAKLFGGKIDGRGADQVVPYVLAAEIPYAELDLAEMVEDMLSETMETTSGGLSIRSDQAEEVTEKCREILSSCRRLRRHLRKIDSLVGKLENKELSQSLRGAGRMVLLSEMRRDAMQTATDPMKLLEDELFEPAGGDKLRVKPEHGDSVRELAERAAELKTELGRDDF
ncbi:MAG: M56 family metallopeptidase [Planctomycetota bacterium]